MQWNGYIWLSITLLLLWYLTDSVIFRPTLTFLTSVHDGGTWWSFLLCLWRLNYIFYILGFINRIKSRVTTCRNFKTRSWWSKAHQILLPWLPFALLPLTPNYYLFPTQIPVQPLHQPLIPLTQPPWSFAHSTLPPLTKSHRGRKRRTLLSLLLLTAVTPSE